MKFTGKTILVVSPDFPYPPNHGGRVDIWNHIVMFKKLGFRIDLVATAKYQPNLKDIEFVKTMVNNLIVCPRKNNILDMFSLLPLQNLSRRKLTQVKLDYRYDLLLIATEHVLSILDNQTLKADQVVLRVQNDETKYFQELYQSSNWGFRKLYYFLESFKIKFMNRQVRQNISNMMFISKDEYLAFQQRFPEINSVFMPPCFSSNGLKQLSLKSNNVLFIGSFFMIYNREAIVWYLKNIHPELSKIPDYTFIIAGNSRGESLAWLYKKCKHYTNIKIHDSPKEIDSLYRSSALFVNPMLHGAGVKLKTIDAIRNGLPVVSTNVGNQGTALENEKDILIADNPKDFAINIIKILQNKAYAKKIVTSAQEKLFLNNNQEHLMAKYLNVILNGSKV